MAWTYRCLNRRCAVLFNEATPKPPRCPKCRSRRARWVPLSVSIAKSAPSADRHLREIADSYGLTDLRSARAGESAAPKPPTPARTIDWGPPGMGKIPVAIGRDGKPQATSGWTGDTVKFTAAERATLSNPLPGLHNHTRVIHRDERTVR